MKIGYIRVSKDKQATILQEDAMKREECKRVFTDKMTGKRFDRPEYLRMLDLARPGDVIVVWRLDRLGRSLKELIETVTDLATHGIELKSLKAKIDTTTPTGKFLFHVMAALTEFESDLISERTQAGLDYFKAKQLFFTFTFDDVAEDVTYLLERYFPDAPRPELRMPNKRTILKQRQQILKLFGYRLYTPTDRQDLFLRAKLAARISSKW